MTNVLPASLSDHDLLVETRRAAAAERCATAALLALLAEVDSRQLYLGEGFNSLFVYATRRLCLSEPAAYNRITAARLSRRFPVVLALLDEGALSLTTVSQLAAHLTEENCEALFAAARYKSKRDVEQLVAAIHPQPDIAPSVRALPASRAATLPVRATGTSEASEEPRELPRELLGGPTAEAPCRPALIAPLAPRRYLIRMTVSEETHQKLQRARDLLRHVVPDGDPAAIVDRALTVLLQQSERRKIGATIRPRAPKPLSQLARVNGRHVPASVRRAVWTRDEGRCAFVGSEGRCSETGGLEFHHLVPFAKGGPTTVENLRLQCRVHNVFEGHQVFGDWRRRDRAKEAAQQELRPDGDRSGAPPPPTAPRQ